MGKWVSEWMCECPEMTRRVPLLQELMNHVRQYEKGEVEGLLAGARVVAQEAVAEAHVA